MRHALKLVLQVIQPFIFMTCCIFAYETDSIPKLKFAGKFLSVHINLPHQNAPQVS